MSQGDTDKAYGAVASDVQRGSFRHVETQRVEVVH